MKFSTFIRENPVGMLLFAIVGGVLSTLLYELFKPGEKPTSPIAAPSVTRVETPSYAFSPCVPGQPVLLNKDAFALRFLAIEDGEIVRKAMESSPSDYARKISAYVQSGEVSRVRSPAAALTVHLYGISSDQTPTEIPLLDGNQTCMRMVSVSRMQDLELRIVIPISSEQGSPERSVLFPRRLFEHHQMSGCAPNRRLFWPIPPRRGKICTVG
jgi:hypothetical protein